jgi:hypothetical protein
MRGATKPPKSPKKPKGEDETSTNAITKDHIAEFEKLVDPAAEIAYLAELWGWTNWNAELVQSIWLTVYHGMIVYAREHQFTNTQTSMFVSMMKTSLEKWVEGGCKTTLFVEEVKAWILKNVKVEEGDSIVSLDVARWMIEYIATTYSCIM